MSLCMHCKVQRNDHYAFCMKCSKWCCDCNVECPVVKKERLFGALMKWTSWSPKCCQSAKCISCVTVEKIERSKGTEMIRSLSPNDTQHLFFQWEEEPDEIF